MKKLWDDLVGIFVSSKFFLVTLVSWPEKTGVECTSLRIASNLPYAFPLRVPTALLGRIWWLKAHPSQIPFPNEFITKGAPSTGYK